MTEPAGGRVKAVSVEAELQARLAADRKLWDIVGAAGFAGRLYDRLLDQLASGAITDVTQAVDNGAMFAICNSRPGYALFAPHHWTADDREEVSLSSVADGLREFDDRARAGRGWDPDRGKTLRWYMFMLCVDAFPNTFKRWLRYTRRHQVHRADISRAELQAPRDELSAVDASIDLWRMVADLEGKQRDATRLALEGYTYKEIAEILGCTEPAVDGLLYRARRTLVARYRGEPA